MRIATVILFLLAFAACSAEPVATVNNQNLHGRTIAATDVAAFLGVPFAAPPIGELRWRGPQEYQVRSASRNATEFAPACMQTQRIVDWYRDLAELSGADRNVVADVPVSEDCLYLNVWTPDLKPDIKLPVMVYVYGGSNRSGWSWEPNYHGHALAANGVVVVSIAYRVGDFGFFAHPDISTGPVVANFGLWDQIAALHWIQDNIDVFGGDPARVTVFGESAGAQNIAALMFSRNADDLFTQSILQSTAGIALGEPRTLEDERARGAKLAQQLGNEKALSIAELRALPADELLEYSEINRDGHYHAPVIDGFLLDETIRTKLVSGDYRKRRFIIGSNADEWYASTPTSADATTLDVLAQQLFPGDHEAALAAVSDGSEVRAQMDRIRTASRMVCPSQYLAAHAATDDTPVWMYRFSKSREGQVGKKWRAYHGVELPYVFGTHDDWFEVSEDDLRVTELTMSYWLQFAKTGNPNSAGTASWPAFRAPAFQVQDLNQPVSTIAAPESELCLLYQKQLAQRQGEKH